MPPTSSPSARAGVAPRQAIVLRRGTVAAAAVASGLALAWAGAATWYILSRDELAQRFFAHQTELRYGYEDRIGDLKGRLEREVTFNLVERTTFERRAEALARRQEEIEARQAWLRALAERSLNPRATTDPPRSVPDAPAGQPVDRKPVPIPFTLRPGGSDTTPAQVATSPAPSSPLRDRLSGVERSLDRMAGEGAQLVEALRRETLGRAARARAALAATGLDPERLAGGAVPGTGGPLVPLPESERAQPFAFLAAELDARVSELIRLQSALRTLPLARPVAGDAESSSGFGYRADPFTRMPALHTGIDFRAETGTSVRATGAGRVVAAEPSGGYGHMVEIDHGGGIATRYGHLSAYAVSAGDRVEAGQAVGRAGSSGRSTGPHLHYETRINGEPVNPARFLEAGRLLASAADALP